MEEKKLTPNEEYEAFLHHRKRLLTSHHDEGYVVMNKSGIKYFSHGDDKPTYDAENDCWRDGGGYSVTDCGWHLGYDAFPILRFEDCPVRAKANFCIDLDIQ